jgi:hypothetical protein
VDLGEERVGALKALLRQCTVNVRADGQSRGAAFWVSHNLLLTCQHVVADHVHVEVVPPGRSARKAAVVTTADGRTQDLALLRVELDEDDRPSAVLLAEGLEECDYYLVGYPAEPGRDTGQEGFTVGGRPRDEADGQMLRLEAGQVITLGMSGGPVLSLASGAVVAVTRFTADIAAPYGGGAVPVGVAARCFPDDVAPLLSDPPVSVKAWRDQLGREAWRALGQTWDMATQVDLTVQGMISQWKICSEVAPEGEPLTASDLGDEVTEAMFSWAQRRRLNGKAEVRLMGRLLARSLFPSTVQSHLGLLADADQVTVRVHVADEGGTDIPLTDIPWELSSVPGQETFLAADSRYRFVRVVDDVAPARVDPVPRIRVLGVVSLPHAWGYPNWHGGQRLTWPGTDSIAAALAKHCRQPQIDYYPLRDCTNDELHDALDGRFDVLHFVGVGRRNVANEAQYAMVANDDGDHNFFETRDLFRWAGEAGVKVVVLEFTGPPKSTRYEPVSPSVLGPVLGGSLNAVVLTRFPAHPGQLSTFNNGFYRSISAGATVPEAVQDGRRRLFDNPTTDDAAGFGCFTVLTGPMSDIQLVRPHTGTTDVRDALQQDVTTPAFGPGPSWPQAGLPNDSFARRG